MSWSSVFLSNPLKKKVYKGWWGKGATITDVKRANKAADLHWFDADTMRFFKTRIESRLLPGDYFISSDQGPDGVRRYSIRRVKVDARIDTIGKFQAYATRAAAIDAINSLP